MFQWKHVTLSTKSCNIEITWHLTIYVPQNSQMRCPSHVAHCHVTQACRKDHLTMSRGTGSHHMSPTNYAYLMAHASVLADVIFKTDNVTPWIHQPTRLRRCLLQACNKWQSMAIKSRKIRGHDLKSCTWPQTIYVNLWRLRRTPKISVGLGCTLSSHTSIVFEGIWRRRNAGYAMRHF